MADYYSIITNRGKELEAEALASGRLIVLTHFVVGDSNGKQVKPDPAQIRLINETYRGDIAELVVSPEQSTQLMAKIVLPTGVGGFTVREVGLMTDAGELYAVANCPSIDKPVGGVSVNMQFRLAVSDTSNITLNVATGDGLFLRIDQNLKEIKVRGAEAQKISRESIGVLDGTTQQRGLVQLSSSVNSTSETQSATPLAVKIAMDNANARLAKERNGADIPNPPLFVQNIGLKPTVDKAANAVDKNGDTMTGELTLLESGVTIKTRNGDSPQYSIKNIESGAECNVDLLGAEVRIFGKGYGSGQVRIATFNLNNGDWSVPGNLRAGNAVFNTEGSLYGNMWGGWIHDWLSANFSARDNNINTRATWDWVNQNFVSNVRFGAVESALVQTVPFGGFNDQAGYVLTGLTQNDGDRVPDNVYRRTLQIYFPSRGWFVVGQ
ncbi:phage tail protein [Citrobacter braakii]|uniref:phage tail-collar fiber domain-containing protein n=1 Tax=Citrobacter braakii TaxID=57706 RepID=UPI001F6103BB|nr:phage tail protein [Citrobacter braakii]